jgi:N-acetyl-anhydromuramyl-L-alanine amidase AmpD
VAAVARGSARVADVETGGVLMRGWCPFADYLTVRTPVQSIPDRNWEPGNDGLESVVLHIMEGDLWGSIRWMNSAGTSAKFCIGKSGQIVQTVSLYDTAYTNGLAYRSGMWGTLRGGVFKRVTPTWEKLQAGWNVNRRTIGIEHEGKSGEPLTPAMRNAQNRLLQWIADELNWSYVVGENLIGHFNLDNIDRARCPGSAFNFGNIAVDANLRPHQKQQWFRVRYPYGANVRQAKDVNATPALGGLRLPQGETFAGEVETGTPWGGDVRWVHLLDQRGFVHMSAVEAL